MRYRYIVLFGVLAAVVAVTSGPVVGQASRTAGSTAASTKPWAAPRTAWGDPDLQGIWRDQTQVSLERPKAYAGRELLTDAEVAALEARVNRQGEDRRQRSLAGELDGLGCRAFPFYNAIQGVSGEEFAMRVSHRTSAIIDPPNGRLPPWSPEQVKRWEAKHAEMRGRGEADTWEDRALSERCINFEKVVAVGRLAPPSSSPDLESGSSGAGGRIQTKRILQIPGSVVITVENWWGDSAYRIIPLDGRPAPGPKIRQWLGDARGHWDGNTLVVEITNFNDKQNGPILPAYGQATVYPGSGETLKITERYTRLDADTIEYRYTINDPETYTRPYTALYELTRDDHYAMYPAQCHENNNLGGDLANARADEVGALEHGAEAALKREQVLEGLKKEWAEELSKSKSR